jgi:hypothetical protein
MGGRRTGEQTRRRKERAREGRVFAHCRLVVGRLRLLLPRLYVTLSAVQTVATGPSCLPASSTSAIWEGSCSVTPSERASQPASDRCRGRRSVRWSAEETRAVPSSARPCLVLGKVRRYFKTVSAYKTKRPTDRPSVYLVPGITCIFNGAIVGCTCAHARCCR